MWAYDIDKNVNLPLLIGQGRMYLNKFSWSSARHVLTRRKYIIIDPSESKLAKVLTTLDLTALGVGSTLGAGIYVLAGQVAKDNAGPSVVISFFIAAVASILAGLCYAEFGARVPKAGSAYIYAYVCIGEFLAFVIGWNLILEYLLGAATLTKAIFTYLDALTEYKMSHFFEENTPMHGIAQIAPYADIFSLCLAIFFAGAIAFGAKESSIINNVFTFINLGVVSTVIISGFWTAETSYWSIPKDQVPPGYGDGGFAPYGIRGIVKGAARCFYGFIGFDCIATAGEEAKNPQKSIPIGTVVSLLIVFFAYFGISTMLTMMLPYYEQDNNAPLIYVYERIGWIWLKYLVSAGAMCGLLSSLLGAMFPLPRVIYAMAADGLIFKFLSRVHPKFKTPLMGTLIGGALAGVLACLIELNSLTNMMSIGTLFAYSVVAACVLILRYGIDEQTKKNEDKEDITVMKLSKQMFDRHSKFPTRLSSNLVTGTIFVYFCVCFVTAGLITSFEDKLEKGEIWLLATLAVLFLILFLMLLSVSFQPTSSQKLSFSVPLVPWVPGVSILINVYLMTTLPTETWAYYSTWLAIGLVVYLTYGMWHSHERGQNKIKHLTDSETSVEMTAEIKT